MQYKSTFDAHMIFGMQNANVSVFVNGKWWKEFGDDAGKSLARTCFGIGIRLESWAVENMNLLGGCGYREDIE